MTGERMEQEFRFGCAMRMDTRGRKDTLRSVGYVALMFAIASLGVGCTTEDPAPSSITGKELELSSGGRVRTVVQFINSTEAVIHEADHVTRFDSWSYEKTGSASGAVLMHYRGSNDVVDLHFTTSSGDVGTYQRAEQTYIGNRRTSGTFALSPIR